VILLIQIFSLVILFAGVILLVKPSIVLGFLRDNSNKLAIHVIAVVVRLVIGFLLISQASQSKFPVAITALGWIFIFAAVSLGIIGRNRFTRLMNWVLAKFGRFFPVSGVIAVLFGGFMIYAFN